MKILSVATLLLSSPAWSDWFAEARVVGGSSERRDGSKNQQLKTLQGYGGNPDPSRFPLQECEGDCDSSEDCDIGLVCFQRGLPLNGVWDEVPGCDAGKYFAAKTDFCIVSPAEPREEAVLTEAPTEGATDGAAVTMSPTTEAYMDLPLLDEVSLEVAMMPLGLCQGGCDSDSSCLDELVCFERELDESVPGCRGDGMINVNYCIKPEMAGEEILTMAPTPSITSGSTEVLFPLQAVSDGGGLPLGICQGDCDTDEDCLDGLICFYREYLEPVPGCTGQGNASYDYCILDPDPTMSPTSIPLPELEIIGNNPKGTLLGLCQGKCKKDNDCEGDLICSKRDREGDEVPGCAGQAEGKNNYCANP